MATLTSSGRKTRTTKTPKEQAMGRILESYRRKVLRIYPTARFENEELLGCDVYSLYEYIEKQFTDGMTWENYGKVWVFARRQAPGTFDMRDSAQFYKAMRYDAFEPRRLEALPRSVGRLLGAELPKQETVLGPMSESARKRNERRTN